MRYEDVDKNVEDVLRDVINEYFPELRICKIKCLFRTKKKKSKGKLVLAEIQKPNDLIRFFTIDESGNETGYDYILTIDKTCWEAITDDEDKIRLIRHELNHCDVDEESENNPFKLRGHDFEDFIVEVDRNRDNPNWASVLAEVTESRYEEG